jgi:hypothetical protein
MNPTKGRIVLYLPKLEEVPHDLCPDNPGRKPVFPMAEEWPATVLRVGTDGRLDLVWTAMLSKAPANAFAGYIATSRSVPEMRGVGPRPGHWRWPPRE